MIVYYACIFLFEFTSCHAICLLVLVISDAHIGPGVIINLEILKKILKNLVNMLTFLPRYFCTERIDFLRASLCRYVLMGPG